MEEKSPDTLKKIEQAAMEEFSDKGFLGASLRQIVKKAGVTTGAFYGYFSSKEALFTAIVEPHAAALMGKFMEAQTSFAELPDEQQLWHCLLVCPLRLLRAFFGLISRKCRRLLRSSEKTSNQNNNCSHRFWFVQALWL